MLRKTFAILVVVCLIFSFQGCSMFEPDYIKQIEEFSKTHPQFTFGEILDFEWEDAYNELNYYGNGSAIKEMTGYDFSVETGSVDHLRRFLFFKDGKLIKEIKYEYLVFEFSDTIVAFYPDTVFDGEWFDYVNNGVAYPHLRITLKE